MRGVAECIVVNAVGIIANALQYDPSISPVTDLVRVPSRRGPIEEGVNPAPRDLRASISPWSCPLEVVPRSIFQAHSVPLGDATICPLLFGAVPCPSTLPLSPEMTTTTEELEPPGA